MNKTPAAQDSLIESQLGAWLEGLKEGGDA
jgi:hypothetical protein